MFLITARFLTSVNEANLSHVLAAEESLPLAQARVTQMAYGQEHPTADSFAIDTVMPGSGKCSMPLLALVRDADGGPWHWVDVR